MRDAMKLMERTITFVVRFLYKWLWHEPVNARGPLWTLLLWVAVASGLAVGLEAPLAFLVYFASRWAMDKIGKPKLPARPVFRR